MYASHKIKGFYKVWDSMGHNLTIVAAPTDEIGIEIANYLFGEDNSMTYIYDNTAAQSTKVLIDKFWIAGVKQGYNIGTRILEYKTRINIIDEMFEEDTKIT